ncbi:MAG: MotA/TolQ/ExbB proton channel family protein [Hyphomicrobium sp.]|uniref:MotA/TolQ/ExbB proton channel family protein n=1 Tax=Hyphomicrobium sp. TaxID=82 RepID=UPI0039E3555D
MVGKVVPRRLPNAGLVTGIALAITVGIIAVLSFVLPMNSTAAALLLDHTQYSVFPYPFTIQNATYVIMAAGIADLYVRWRTAKYETAFLKQHFLPEDDTSVLQLKDLGPVRAKVVSLYDGDNGFLPYLIDISITQLQASRSVDQAVAILTSSLDLLMHRLDLRYQNVRYISWLIPTIGFIGTVVGIAVALEVINPKNPDIGKVTGAMAVAFYTTLIALIVSAIIVFLQHAVQKKEESALNSAGQYVLKNLINRLYIPDDVGQGSQK